MLGQHRLLPEAINFFIYIGKVVRRELTVFSDDLTGLGRDGTTPRIDFQETGDSGMDVAVIGGSIGASWLGTARGALGTGAGLLNMLAQLRAPSGFEGCLTSSVGGGCAISADMFSQGESV